MARPVVEDNGDKRAGRAPPQEGIELDRRRFLRGLAGAAALAALPAPARAAVQALPAPQRARLAAELTTLAQTLRPGAAGALGYRPVVSGPGEAHTVRQELATAAVERAAARVSLLSFVHLTDQHITDVQSPTRVEFLDRYADGPCAPIPFSSAHRPQEAASARVTDAMLRRLRRIRRSPVTGAPFAAMVSTGDNTDNQQRNELELFLGLMDGGPVAPQSGDPTRYEGVQASGDTTYWHPDPRVADVYKTRYGFPSSPGFLERALAPFAAAGTGVPWYTCYGNHDGLAQGNVAGNAVFEAIGTSGAKVVGLPPGANPCQAFAPTAAGVVIPVTADPARRYVTRREWIAAHLESRSRPVGHGFTAVNVTTDTAYYAADVGALRFITLDTVNPGGRDGGSIGEAQLRWLERQLAAADAERRLVVLFSHHGPRSLDNPVQAPNPLDPAGSDLPRRQRDAVLARIAPYRCVIAWVSGHTHNNVVAPRQGFWDIGTAAHIDWPSQSRIIDVVDNRDGTLSLFATMVDHDDEPVASFARELCGNDPQDGFAKGTGGPADRNVELLLPHPFA